MPTPSFVTANGLRFAYLEEGNGPLVLLVHGFPDTPHTWDAARPALARAGFRAVSPWTRGYAPTEIPAAENFALETLAKDILALIDALGEQRCILVGHDWGAAATYLAASLAPEKIRQMITVAISHPASLKPSPLMLWKIRHFFLLSRKRAAAKIRKGDFKHIDELVHRWSPAWDVPAGETDAVKASLREPGSLEASLGYYRAFSPKRHEALRKPIQVPSVAFAGATDVIPRSIYDKAKKFYASSYEIVDMPGGHFMHREDPDRFVSELLRVVAAAPAQAPAA